MRLRRRAALVAILVAALAASGWMFRERIVLGWLAMRTPPTTVAAREALLEPALRVYAPANVPPPWPVVLQFHGCAGVKIPFQEQWARAANDAGWLAVVVDSNAPRGIDRERALKTVCNGKELIGQERAGDVAAAIVLVRKRTDVDPDRIVLAGWSHGAWTVMDFLALDGAGRTPAGLADAPQGPTRVAGAFLVYPHCGTGAWTRLLGWGRIPQTLALVAGADTVVDPGACPPVFARLAKSGPVNAHVYPGAEHGFDDAWLPEGYADWFDEEARDDAMARYRAFLKSLP